MSNLHPGQFGRLLDQVKSSGGFTEHLPTEVQPTSGFMVSDYGAERQIPSSQTTEDDLRNFAVEKGLTTSPPGESMGVWRSDKGIDFLDRTRRYPSDSRGMVAMATQNQISMYDASKAPDADDAYTENPGYVEDYNEDKAAAQGSVIPTWLRPTREEKPSLRAAPRRS